MEGDIPKRASMKNGDVCAQRNTGSVRIMYHPERRPRERGVSIGGIIHSKDKMAVVDEI